MKGDINRFDVSKYEYRKEIYRLTTQIEEKKQLEEKICVYQDELNKVLNSTSWKITEPLRRLMRFINKIGKKEKINTIDIKDNFKDQNYKTVSPYNSEYQKNKDFSKYKTDIKALAFYLPQFHEFKENNEWWGKGFTEWTNTKKSLPRFEGHYQPRIPNEDIGYYTLDNIDTIKKQVILAKQHGLYGFCYYYYWFSGKRLMEKPVDLLLNDKSVNFPFCLCWANENWSRRWDGQQDDILIKQEYSKADYKKFIVDIKKYLQDDRYIRVDGKPMILVYNPSEIPNFKEQVEAWRKYAKEENIGELYILSKCDLSNNEHKFTEFVDGEFDFQPHGLGHKGTELTGLDSPKIFNYSKIIDEIEHLYIEHFPLKDFYHSVTMGWDNSARRKGGYTIYMNYSLEKFYKWINIIKKENRRRLPEDRRFIFINAWNEWAEGTYLEPDEKYGYANINTLSKAIFDLPLEENGKSKEKLIFLEKFYTKLKD